MEREKSLIKNTVVLAIGRFLPTLFSLVAIPIVTGCLTKAEYGTYDLVATLIVLLLPIATLQIQSAAFRFLIKSRDDEDRSRAIISNIFFVTIIVSVIVLVIFILVFPDKISIQDKIIIACYFMANIIQATLGQVARGLGKNRDFSAAAIILAGINALLVYILVKTFSMGFSGVFIALAVADASAAAFLAIRIRLPRYLSSSVLSKSVIKEMISYSWPMVPNNLSNWVLKLSDRLVITAFLGVEANAVYAVANKIPNMLSMAQSVFVMAWHENASISIDDPDVGEYYRKMLDRTFSMLFGLTAVLIGCTPIVFKILIRGDYDDAYIQMPILILGMFFYVMSSYFGGIYIAHMRTKSVGITTLVAAGVNLLIDLLFVRKIGITAGSVSTLVAYFLLYVYRAINVQKFQKVEVNIGKQVLQVTTMIAMLVICSLRIMSLDILNFVLGLVLCIMANWTIIKFALSKVFYKKEQS